MRENLTDLSERHLLNKIQAHYTQINKYRGPHITPTFDEVGFLKAPDGKKFLVGITHYFNNSYSYGKEEGYKDGSTPHLTSFSWTFAVLLDKGKLTNIAFEINAHSSEEHISDYSPSLGAKTIKEAGRLKWQIPAKSSVSIIYHQDKEHPFNSFQSPKFYNVADRRKIIDLLTENAPKHKNDKPQEEQPWHDTIISHDDMIKTCKDLISPTKKDIEAAQDYRHHLNTLKISAQRQAINEIGGSSNKPRHPLTKAWLNLRSQWIARNRNK